MSPFHVADAVCSVAMSVLLVVARVRPIVLAAIQEVMHPSMLPPDWEATASTGGGSKMDAQGDSSTSALLVLHYQNGLVRHEGVFAFSGTAAQVEKHNTLEKTAAVLGAARAAGMQVVYVNIEFRPGFPELKKPTYPLIESIQERNAFLRGSWDAGVPEELEPGPDDIIVINFDSSAFSHTDLDAMLRARGTRRL